MERPPERDHEELAEEAEEQADALGSRSKDLEERVMEVRRDWKSKRADPSVPGAPPDDAPSDETPPDADIEDTDAS
jgi:hypothetical protein